MPRLAGAPGFTAWTGGPVSMHYEGPTVQLPLSLHAAALAAIFSNNYSGSNSDKLDLFFSLHDFGLKTDVVVEPTLKSGTIYEIKFTSWKTKAFDRYDWDPAKSLTVPNPDYLNPFGVTNPVTPSDKTVKVYHSNAARIEKAGLAKPFDVESTEWNVIDPSIVGPADVDKTQPL